MGAGREVIVGIRPECIGEATRTFSGVTQPSLTVDARVDMIEPTGAENIVMVRLGNERALARVSPDVRHRLGEMAKFSIDTRKINLFDPATGNRIA